MEKLFVKKNHVQLSIKISVVVVETLLTLSVGFCPLLKMNAPIQLTIITEPRIIPPPIRNSSRFRPNIVLLIHFGVLGRLSSTFIISSQILNPIQRARQMNSLVFTVLYDDTLNPLPSQSVTASKNL